MIFLKYSRYSPTDIDWLGAIPKHWQLLKIKRLSIVKRGASPRPIDEPKYFDDEGEYSWVRIADVTASERYLRNTTQRMSDLGKASSVPLEPGELFISICATVGKPIITKIKCCIHDGFVYFPMLKEDRNYFYYLFMSGQLYLGLGKMGTQLNLNTETVGNISIALPPIDEQKTIASFLDHKTTQIDNLISEKEKLLKLLEEKRIALITQAVTKGLNPNVKLKPSGVDWLGDIPVHWEVKRLKYFVSINPKKSEIPQKDINISFVPMDTIGEYGGISLETEKHITEVYNGYTYFKENDVVIAKITPCFENGKGARAENLLNGIAFGTTELHVLRSSENITPQYLETISFSYPFRKWGEAEMYGAGGQKRVPEEFLKNFLIGIPPVEEQAIIINRINDSLKRLRLLKESIISAIENLKEYRTSLITSAVTGKIDVRNYKPKEEYEKVH